MQPDKQTPKGDLGQIVDKLKGANNVLVTISTNPTVDQFAACIGLTLVLNKLGKHTNAVFSGAVPSTIDFLQPEKTIEKNTDSLRDFIIALDKSKADKLRYKVEDDVVKIFITPYRTSISEKDLEYSQGDFNVDAIVALGVHERNQLDSAILAHGRILHDAVVISMNTTSGGKLGSINWVDPKASSLCEMVADVSRDLSANVFDTQNATAFLTGIVAETDRYSNEKVTPHTMSVAGVLMSAGASTQLVSTKLEAQKEEVLPEVTKKEEKKEIPKEDDGVIEIDHSPENPIPPPPAEDPPSDEDHGPNQILIDETGQIKKLAEETVQEDKSPTKNRIISEPPRLGGQLTANSRPAEEQYTGSTDPLSNMPDKPLLKRDHGSSRNISKPKTEEEPQDEQLDDAQTITELELSVGSPHTSEVPETSVDDARTAVEKATNEVDIDDPRPQARVDQGATSFDASKDAAPSSPPPPVPPPFVPESK